MLIINIQWFFSLCSTLMSRNTVKIIIIRKMDVSSQTFQDDTHANPHTHAHFLCFSEDCLCSTLKWCNTLFIIYDLYRPARLWLRNIWKRQYFVTHLCDPTVCLSVCLLGGVHPSMAISILLPDVYTRKHSDGFPPQLCCGMNCVHLFITEDPLVE